MNNSNISNTILSTSLSRSNNNRNVRVRHPRFAKRWREAMDSLPAIFIYVQASRHFDVSVDDPRPSVTRR